VSIDLWQSVAVGEEAAVYAYGVLTPRLDEGERPRAIEAHTVHSRARDAAVAELAAAGADASLPTAFSFPFNISDAADARRLAALVEDRLVNIYCTWAPELAGPQRRRFVESARECCARAVSWGQRPAALPGGGQPDMSAVPDGRRAGGGTASAAPPGDGATLAP
jgi:hypothetical protein